MAFRIDTVGTIDEQPIEMIEMANDELTVRVLTIGAALWQVRPTADPDGPNMCLAHDDPADYAIAGRHVGVTVGPFANRIADSRFTLDGTEYHVEANEGPHSLHGGPSGFGQRMWSINSEHTGESAGQDYATFDLHRLDGEGGYPGDLSVSVTWMLDGPTLTFSWTAHTSARTPVSITSHAYWNLGSEASIRDHELRVDAPRYVETDAALIPTGNLVEVAGTPYDLRELRRVGDVMGAVPRGLLDDCYVFDGLGRSSLVDPASGRSIDMVTSMPGVQIYTADDGVCMETQHLPDAPNHDNFPSSIVEPEELARHQTQYTFGLG